MEKIVNFAPTQNNSLGDLIQMCLAGGHSDTKAAPLDAMTSRELASFNLPLQRSARDLNGRVLAFTAGTPSFGHLMYDPIQNALKLAQISCHRTETAMAPWI
jgi:hypothetical protein